MNKTVEKIYIMTINLNYGLKISQIQYRAWVFRGSEKKK